MRWSLHFVACVFFFKAIKVNKNQETHLHERPQEITLNGHDDSNIVIDYEQADLVMCRLHTFIYPLFVS